ncbi:lipase 3-like [Belonocnema kinseyi]|uniref:lipase 3-like n=1 Tax=Belonocnema kinseyi TaxID=2817044 RepID=UPI00143DA0DE|nr:lipase 3-like [Belonocnema kinseyi]
MDVTEKFEKKLQRADTDFTKLPDGDVEPSLFRRGPYALTAFSRIIKPQEKEVEYLDFLDKVDVKDIVKALKEPSDDAKLTTVELIDKYGYNPETHTVVTYDKYILEMHRITGPKNNSDPDGKPAVLLLHGIFMSSADWIILGPGKALGYILADAGYDVWIGNVRGNTYCRKHLNSAINEKDFWSFSWHEIGSRDLPAMIDFILEKTGNRKIFYIGHSQGTTNFFVMASELPEYNDKIISMHALAPVAYCQHMTSPPLRFLSMIDHQLSLVTKFFGMYELRLTKEFYNKFTSKFCAENSILQPLCSNLLFMISGFNPSQMNMTLLPTILGHTPAGASVKQTLHYSQLMKKNYFRQYDYGFSGNLKKYGRLSPPDYDLSLITTPVILHYSANDWLAHIKDVESLYKELGNPVAKIRVPLNEFNHLDFLWAKDANTLLYEKILGFMSLYEKETII